MKSSIIEVWEDSDICLLHNKFFFYLNIFHWVPILCNKEA